MVSSRIIPTLGAIFFVGTGVQAANVIGETHDMLRSSSDERAANSSEPTPSFSELDEWESELRDEARRLDEQKIATDLAMAEAKRQTEKVHASQTHAQISGERARKLAAVYGSMEPDFAAETLAALPISKSALVIAEMAPDIAGPILAAMPPKTNRQIANHLLELD